jgi:4-alpha-glucanotransferase
MNVPPFPADYRASGVLLHVTSLPSPYGIGDLGPTAVAWIDRLHDAGQGWWQLLPLGPTGYGDSPYQPLSSFAGNVLFISPAWLIEDGLVRASDCGAVRDVLNLGTDARMNQPGTAHGNWRWRAPADLLSAPALESLRVLTQASCRSAAVQPVSARRASSEQSAAADRSA